MTEKNTQADRPGAQSPVDTFSHAHSGILSRLDAFSHLPELLDAAAKAREVARTTLALFEPGVLDHHTEEEKDLFPAVIASARDTEERDRVLRMVERLTAEHRAVEEWWRHLKGSVKSAAAGREANLSPAEVHELVQLYTAHARFEEEHFLPLAQQILERNDNHLAALGLALHLRHIPQPVGYI
ncbi:hemerythrin domain-containing protein [Caenimonas sp. SL110]|uniref:hemerythrin domain-containing protein n=1 Tax=Caenimonas sp. SL110 TaxID=1450524 RepID=UPI0006529511|nr:hemerythrin domain-containing protein [Caenimonas sp. SL110]